MTVSMSPLTIPHHRGTAPKFNHFEIIPAYGQEGYKSAKQRRAEYLAYARERQNSWR